VLPYQDYHLSNEDIGKIEYLLKKSSFNPERIFSLILEMLSNIINQQFIIDEKNWNKNKSNRNFLTTYLNNIYSTEINWQNETFFENSMLRHLINVNNYYHNYSVTRGAKKYYSKIIKEQGGEYCVLCGSRLNLEVDHIIPVRRGGSIESVQNMQILCSSCNKTKNDNLNDFLPEILKNHLSSRISKQLSYKVLYDNSILNVNRKIGQLGVCQMCGCDASQKTLYVIVNVPFSAANYSNLLVLCSDCRKRRH